MPLRWEAIQHVSWSLETRLEYETRLDSSSLLSTLADTIGWHQGNLAAVTALQARDLPLEPPLLVQALIYPVTNYSFDTPTYARYGTRYGLDADWMRWFWYDHDHDHDNEQQRLNPLNECVRLGAGATISTMPQTVEILEHHRYKPLTSLDCHRHS